MCYCEEEGGGCLEFEWFVCGCCEVWVHGLCVDPSLKVVDQKMEEGGPVSRASRMLVISRRGTFRFSS